MTTEPTQVEVAGSPKKAVLWAGRIASAIPVLMMGLSAVMKISPSAEVLASWGPRFGFPDSTLLAIGVTELVCAVLYAIPRTAVLGAILVTAYLGGATVAHVRIGDIAFIAPVVVGIVAWGGLFLRDARLRALLPLVR